MISTKELKKIINGDKNSKYKYIKSFDIDRPYSDYDGSRLVVIQDKETKILYAFDVTDYCLEHNCCTYIGQGHLVVSFTKHTQHNSIIELENLPKDSNYFSH